ncbi:tail fiber domain-containing protein [Pseudomonas citronellolis]|uniref:tail fiber domain-containing protein n=1 Tax=Pseudomonas citronellolis TaxID=53408 RepID=UPI0023E42BC7|nr:tail fiber domain-containing protein [Pseudomonas citronellolis]MDF3932162.1 tail fiber domain-containing protein [Pseudomonas citronellolis]
MANTNIPLRMQYTGSAVTAVAEYQADETMALPGSLQLTGAGRRFYADFSNATLASRMMFQTTASNSSTTVGAVPSGSGISSAFTAFSSADPTNAVGLTIAGISTECRVASSVFGSASYVPLTFYNGGAERMRIGSDGYVYLGATVADVISAAANGITYNPTIGLRNHFNSSNPSWYLSKSAAGTIMQFYYTPSAGSVNGVGSISMTTTTTAYNTSSDYRLKHSVTDLDEDEAEARIMAFRPVWWLWNFDDSYGKGFIAHENQAVDPSTASGKKDETRRIGNVRLPDYSLVAEGVDEPADMSTYPEGAEWVFTEEVPVYQGRDDSKMIPDIVAMLHKMRRELDDARAEIEALKAAS